MSKEKEDDSLEKQKQTIKDIEDRIKKNNKLLIKTTVIF